MIVGDFSWKETPHSEVVFWLLLSELSFVYAQWQPHFTTKLLYFTTKEKVSPLFLFLVKGASERNGPRRKGIELQQLDGPV